MGSVVKFHHVIVLSSQGDEISFIFALNKYVRGCQEKILRANFNSGRIEVGRSEVGRDDSLVQKQLLLMLAVQ